MLHHLILLLASTSISLTTCEESSFYLQNAVRGLRNLNLRQTLRRADVASLSSNTQLPPPSVERRAHHLITEDAPAISLTKGELAAMYEAAIAKGETIKLDTGTADSSFIQAAVHHLDDDHDEISQHSPEYNDRPPSNGEDGDGYYYYYYPIKSFLDEITSQPSSGNGHSNAAYSYHKPHVYKEVSTYKPPYQFHSHTHQHNITITKQDPEDKPKHPKPMEPLFMAISGFIGMALMFVLSILVFPRFGIKPKDISGANKKNERINDIARLALQAIDQECAERFACELTKTARTFNISENRFVRLLKRIAPGTFGRHLNKVGKYSNKHLQCTAIPCKKKIKNNNNVQKNKKNHGPAHRNKH